MRASGYLSTEIIGKVERGFLVGIEFPREEFPLTMTLSELASLAKTAGASVVGQLTQKRQAPDPKYYLGSGKLQELKAQVAATNANLIIFDHELSPAQERNLEDILEIKVIDRTELILDIFARHATSHEGKLQVELAQASFLLTRLSGHGALMSRLGGGIGTRGPGETKLEYDRRLIRSKISQLGKEIEKLRRERQVKREKRQHSYLPVAAIVGYTNAGKSTLINALTKSTVLTQDQLFATLDPTTRKIYLPSGRTALLTDTVGFIQKLPHTLVTAFQATLEEIKDANLLLHVVDAANPDFEKQIAAVYGVLEELDCITKPIITIFNKNDKREKKLANQVLHKYRPAVVISAANRSGLDKLVATIDDRLPGPQNAAGASTGQKSPA